MKTAKRRFELWHTIVTLLALTLCTFLTFGALGEVQGPKESVIRPVNEVVRAAILVLLGAIGCIYLLIQLWEQAVLLVRK